LTRLNNMLEKIMKIWYFENTHQDKSNDILYDIVYLCILVEKYSQSKLNQNYTFLNGSSIAGRREYYLLKCILDSTWVYEQSTFIGLVTLYGVRRYLVLLLGVFTIILWLLPNFTIVTLFSCFYFYSFLKTTPSWIYQFGRKNTLHSDW